MLAFGDPFGPVQALGAAAILAGIALSALPGDRRPGLRRLRPALG